MTNSLILHRPPAVLMWTTIELLHHDCLSRMKTDRLLRNSTQCTSSRVWSALWGVYSEEGPRNLGPRCEFLQLRQFVTIFLEEGNERTFSSAQHELILPPSKVARACKVNMDLENVCMFRGQARSQAVVVSVSDNF